MSKNRLSAVLSLLVIVVILLGVSIKPQILQLLPLSKTDRQLLSIFSSDVEPTRVPTVILLSEITEPTRTQAIASVAAQAILKPNATESALVARVIDGDTIELADGRTVRYIGIDTPETKHPTKGVQCFGKEASMHNQSLVLGKNVVLENDVSTTDRYGRLLKYVWLDGELINYRLVAEGYALASSYPPDIARQATFREAENQARLSSLGLWSACN